MEKRREDASRGIAYKDTGREGAGGQQYERGTRGKQQERENQRETAREVEPR
jgi:hypothetical protein